MNQRELSQVDYKKTLEMLLDLEKRLDERQHEMLTTLKRDFSQAIAVLD